MDMADVASEARFCPARPTLTNRGSVRAFRGSISRDLLNRWSLKSFSLTSSMGLRFSKNFCAQRRNVVSRRQPGAPFTPLGAAPSRPPRSILLQDCALCAATC